MTPARSVVAGSETDSQDSQAGREVSSPIQRTSVARVGKAPPSVRRAPPVESNDALVERRAGRAAF